MCPTEADLSPDERRRETATILAAGILRLAPAIQEDILAQRSTCTQHVLRAIVQIPDRGKQSSVLKGYVRRR